MTTAMQENVIIQPTTVVRGRHASETQSSLVSELSSSMTGILVSRSKGKHINRRNVSIVSGPRHKKVKPSIMQETVTPAVACTTLSVILTSTDPKTGVVTVQPVDTTDHNHPSRALTNARDEEAIVLAGGVGEELHRDGRIASGVRNVDNGLIAISTGVNVR